MLLMQVVTAGPSLLFCFGQCTWGREQNQGDCDFATGAHHGCILDAQALQQCGISTSVSTHMAKTEVAVDGNVEGLLSEIDRILASETKTAKDVADAAVALAYLQAKGDRL